MKNKVLIYAGIMIFGVNYTMAQYAKMKHITEETTWGHAYHPEMEEEIEVGPSKGPNEFHISQVINDTNKNLKIKANNDTLLEIPAKKTVTKAIVLPTESQTILGVRPYESRKVIGISDNLYIFANDDKIYRIYGYRGKIGNDIDTGLSLVAPNHANAAVWKHDFKSTEDNDNYYIQLHFIEDTNGFIKPASEKLKVVKTKK